MISSCIIVLLLLLIIMLLMIKNRKCRVCNYLEHYINDNDNKINGTSGNECFDVNSQPIGCSSNLIGEKGVLQTLPHCNDIPYEKYPNNQTKKDIDDHKFPKCCDEESFNKRKCNRLFPKNPVLLRVGDEWVKSDTNYRDDSKYIYNPIFPYSRKKFNDRPNILTRIANKSIGKITNNKGSINNIGRIGSVTIPGRDTKIPTTINENNMDILGDYAKDLAYGKDSLTGKCSKDDGYKYCQSMGTNRWEKIGKCAGSERDKWSYVDVTNKNVTNNTNKLRGLLPNIIYDLGKIFLPGKGILGVHSCDTTSDGGLHYASGLTDDII